MEHHTFKDGRSVQINPDGTRFETRPDGTTVEITATGEVNHLKAVDNETYRVVDPAVLAAEREAANAEKQQKQERRIIAEREKREARKRGEDGSSPAQELSQPKEMSFMAMKKLLKQNGIDVKMDDQCMGKRELETLANECGVSLA